MNKTYRLLNRKDKAKSAVSTILMGIFTLALAVMLSSCGSGSDGDSAPGQDSASAAKIGDFTTVDIGGGEVDQDVFADSDITLVNYWATYCRPCIQEMPELQRINEKYAGKAKVLGVIVDVNFDDADSTEYRNALKILDYADAEFTNIKPYGGIAELMQEVTAVPTSYLVDSDGEIIGDPIVGANTEEYKARIDEYLAAHEQE